MTALRHSHTLHKSPATSTRPDDWRDLAVCRNLDSEASFEDNDRDATREAKAACAWCPVRAECEDHAEDTRPHYGVWAGKLWVNGDPTERDTRKVAPPTNPRCGTEQGYQSHRHRQTERCGPCKAAHVAHEAERRRAELQQQVAAARAILQEAARGAA